MPGSTRSRLEELIEFMHENAGTPVLSGKFEQPNLSRLLENIPRDKAGYIAFIADIVDAIVVEKPSFAAPTDKGSSLYLTEISLKNELFSKVIDLVYSTSEPDLIRRLVNKASDSQKRGDQRLYDRLFTMAASYGDTPQGRLVLGEVAVLLSRSDYHYEFQKQGIDTTWMPRYIIQAICERGDAQGIYGVYIGFKEDTPSYFAEALANSQDASKKLKRFIEGNYDIRFHVVLEPLAKELADLNLGDLLKTMRDSTNSNGRDAMRRGIRKSRHSEHDFYLFAKY